MEQRYLTLGHASRRSGHVAATGRLLVAVLGLVVAAIAVAAQPIDTDSRRDATATVKAAAFRFVGADKTIGQEWVCRSCFQKAISGSEWRHHFQAEDTEEEMANGLARGPNAILPHEDGTEGSEWADEGTHDCRADLDSPEPGCHAAINAREGRCVDLHSPCGAELGANELISAIRSGDLERLKGVLRTMGSHARLNHEREAIQLIDCHGAVVGHWPLGDIARHLLAS
jgi:hypothetical protein